MVKAKFHEMKGESGEYFIAYLDMLGTKEKILGKDESLYRYKLHGIYHATLAKCKEEYADFGFDSLDIKIFSDNIVISKRISQNQMEDFFTILYFVALFQIDTVIDENWLVRGGLTRGQLFIDDIMIWGKGLVRAYSLEDKVAIYPRIIIDSNVINFIENNDVEISEIAPTIMEDFDRQFFIDYITTSQIIDGGIKETINKMNFDVLNEIKDCKDDRILQKLYWQRNYINKISLSHDKS